MYKVLFATIVAVVCVALVGSASVGAATNKNNGNKSINKAVQKSAVNLNVTQANQAVQRNTVDVSQNTGYNSANKNTGGKIEITTGVTEAAVGIANAANENSVTVDSCGCDETSVSAKNVGNGNRSHNTAKVSDTKSTSVSQYNHAKQINTVRVAQDSGSNEANKNTNGSVNISTSNTTTTANIDNVANSNIAVIE
jgi:hypothetical protein